MGYIPKPMSNLRVLSISLGRRGGFPVYGLEMTRALSKICDIGVLVASGSDNIDEWRRLACPIFETPTYHDRLSAALSFFNIPKFICIKKFIASFRPDVIYYPGLHYWKPVIDHLVPKSAVLAVTIHDPLPHPGERHWFVNSVLSRLETRKPDCYILLNDAQKDRFVENNKISAEKVLVVPHGIFSSYRESLSSLKEIQGCEELIGFEGKYFLFVGRIVKYKGIATLFKAFREAIDRTDKLLVVAGSGNFSGEESAALNQLPSDRVKIFNRWLGDKEIATLTANAFMTVLPYEGATQSGIVPLSAAFGTPSIVSDSGGLKEQVSDGETGFVFASGDTDALSKLLIDASDMSKDRYVKMRECSFQNANENWGWDSIAGKVLRFLNKTIMPSRARSAR
jgi:glycosyltransferase involved in cell wall biosynthesis